MNCKFFITLLLILLQAHSSLASSDTGSFHFVCRELLDLATYDTKVNEKFHLDVGESVDFIWDMSASERVMSPMTSLRVSLIDYNGRMNSAYLKLNWTNFANGGQVEANEEIVHFFKGDKLTVELRAQRYSNIFRNSCSIESFTNEISQPE